MPRTHEPGGRERKNSGSIHVAPGTFKRFQRRNRIGEQFAARTIEMLKSPAFCVLSLGARRFLDRLEIELAAHAGRDNGNLPLTFDQCVAYGIYRAGIAPAVRECVALGFVEVTQVGRASATAEYRHPSKYRLTYKPTEGGPSTDEWQRIKTHGQAEMIAQAARLSPPKKTKRQYLKPDRGPVCKQDWGEPKPQSVNRTTRQVRKPDHYLYSQGTGVSPGSRETVTGIVLGIVAEQLDALDPKLDARGDWSRRASVGHEYAQQKF
jgi:hypothetical protein